MVPDLPPSPFRRSAHKGGGGNFSFLPFPSLSSADLGLIGSCSWLAPFRAGPLLALRANAPARRGSQPSRPIAGWDAGEHRAWWPVIPLDAATWLAFGPGRHAVAQESVAAQENGAHDRHSSPAGAGFIGSNLVDRSSSAETTCAAGTFLDRQPSHSRGPRGRGRRGEAPRLRRVACRDALDRGRLPPRRVAPFSLGAIADVERVTSEGTLNVLLARARRSRRRVISRLDVLYASP